MARNPAPLATPRGRAAALAAALRDLLAALGPAQVIKAFPGDDAGLDALMAAVRQAEAALRRGR